MSEVITIGDRTIKSSEIVNLLASYQLLPYLWREVAIDNAIASIEMSLQEEALAQEQFDKKHQFATPAQRTMWGEQRGISEEQVTAIASREIRIEKFKTITWGTKLEAYFLTHKSKLDKVVYSLLRTKEIEIANELYFRIQAGEQSFAQLAREYSQGPEAQTGGLLGPMELSSPHPTLAKMLSVSQPGQLWPPTRLGEWFVIVRLEKFIPAVLDEAMQRQLLNNLFEAWLQEQLSSFQLLSNQKGLVAA